MGLLAGDRCRWLSTVRAARAADHELADAGEQPRTGDTQRDRSKLAGGGVEPEIARVVVVVDGHRSGTDSVSGCTHDTTRAAERLNVERERPRARRKGECVPTEGDVDVP